MIQPLCRGVAAEGAGAGGLSAIVGGAVRGGGMLTPPGRATMAAGGSALAAGAGTLSVLDGSEVRGSPANGSGSTEAAWVAPPGFTFKVLTITGRIGSLEPGVGRAAVTVAGGSRRTGALLALARLKRCGSLLSGVGAGSATAARGAIGLGPASAIAGAMRLVEAFSIW